MSMPHQPSNTAGNAAVTARVLVLDDDESIRRLLKLMLNRAGCEVDTASNGRQGLQMLLTKTFDVTIVDMRMQEMDGITFIQEAKKIWPWQGFVIYSGHVDQQMAAAAAREGIGQVLTKPLDMKALQAAVLSEARRQRERLPQGAMPVNLIGHHLTIMRHMSRDVLHTHDLQNALTRLGRTIAEIMPHDVMGILSVEDDEKLLLLQGRDPQPESVFTQLSQYITNQFQSLSGSYLDPASLRIEQPAPPSSPVPGRELKSIASVPVITGDEIHGILALGSMEADAFTEISIALLYHAASNLSTLFSALKEMRLMATRDPLTGLYNRRHLDEELERCWRLCNRHNHGMAVLMLDMDQLKEINDQWGHNAGDDVIREFAAILKAQTRSTDILARFGGDEFVIILLQADEHDASVLANRIIARMRDARILMEDGEKMVTASIGVAVYNPGHKSESHGELLKQADHALYRAKSEGRNRYAFWTEHNPTAGTASPVDETPSPRKGRVLILDDEEFVLLIVRRILEDESCTVTTVRTIAEATTALKSNDRHFDIFLCDLSLPDGDGMDVLRLARESDNAMINIVISGNVTADNAIAALRHGAYDFIQKPIIAETLTALVDRALQYRTLMLENARYRDYLEEMVRAKKSELSKALEEIKRAYAFTLETMVAMLDAREFETGQHSVRVRDLTLHLARRMGIAGEQLDEIGRGALLHDIGKIGIPDAVLLKPGSLTEDEWEVMKTHPDIGYRFLKNSAFLQTAAGVVRSHHERWDGKGYPQKLKGKEINLGARIFAVIDAYDAMRSTRVYKKSISIGEATAELRKESGGQFDPEVVLAFLACQDEIETIGGWARSFT